MHFEALARWTMGSMAIVGGLVIAALFIGAVRLVLT